MATHFTIILTIFAISCRKMLFFISSTLQRYQDRSTEAILDGEPPGIAYMAHRSGFGDSLSYLAFHRDHLLSFFMTAKCKEDRMQRLKDFLVGIWKWVKISNICLFIDVFWLLLMYSDYYWCIVIIIDVIINNNNYYRWNLTSGKGYYWWVVNYSHKK